MDWKHNIRWSRKHSRRLPDETTGKSSDTPVGLSPGSKSRRDRGGDYSTRLFEPKFTTSICLSITCPGEAIDCKMRPVMLVTFDDEIVLKAYCIRPVVTKLSQYTDQRVPDGTTMPRFAAADVDRILAGRSGSFHIPYELANQKTGILSDCSRHGLSLPGSA